MEALRKICDPYNEHQGNLKYDGALSTIVDEVRHGLFHDGMTGSNISISASSPHVLTIEENSNKILINPHYLYDNLLAYFNDYIKQLMNPDNLKLRENFEKRWSEIHS